MMTDAMPALVPLSGWGRTPTSVARVHAARGVDDVVEVIRSRRERGVVARGEGRSYGDAAQNAGGVVVDVRALDDLHVRGTSVRVGAGMRLGPLIEALLPQGLFVPVTPGTRYVTVGGLVAADVHGKNHHSAGSWGHHIQQLRLVDGTGAMRTLAPHGPDPDAFWATVGGMGLTGVITEVTFTALPVNSSRIAVTTSRHGSLAEVRHALREADVHAEYSVAWIDCLDAQGRGIVSTGRHMDDGHLDPRPPSPRLGIPSDVPLGVVTRPTVGLFNQAWFRWSGRPRSDVPTSLWSYFYPLDGVTDWNRLYGKRGFIQYQIAVPDDAEDVIDEALQTLRTAGSPSFLAVLKRFGNGNEGPLSFPLPGWTLALDIPATIPDLAQALDALDRSVASAGGRHYLAKDSRMSSAALRAGYPRIDDWLRVRSRLDPHQVFQSDLGRRLSLTAPG